MRTPGQTRSGRSPSASLNGKLLTAEEVILGHRLNRMHLIAGLVSAAIALAVALYLAFTLSRPLREIRAGAEAMGAASSSTRVRETGDEEVRSVAHALNALAETLQHEEEVRKASVADLAHELRTPLMGLLGRIEAAQDGVLADDAANLAAMHDEALRLSRLLDDLSTAGRRRAPRHAADLEQVDLADVAAGQVQAAASEFADKGIALTSDLAPAAVAGDRGRLDQVVANLLSNALRYTDAGGRVNVDRPARRRRRGARGRRHRHRHRRGGPAARVHALLARREVALAGDRRRRHRPLHRPGAGARPRRQGRGAQRRRSGVDLHRHHPGRRRPPR